MISELNKKKSMPRYKNVSEAEKSMERIGKTSKNDEITMKTILINHGYQKSSKEPM